MSSIQRALMWTLPGAALASLPFGAFLQNRFVRTPLIAPPIHVELAFCILVPSTLLASCLAIRSVKESPRRFVSTLLVAFNAMMLLITFGVTYSFVFNWIVEALSEALRKPV